MTRKDTRTAARKAPKKRGKKAAKKTTKRKVAKKTTQRKVSKKSTKRKTHKRPKRLEGRPTRLRYDRDGNVIGIYVPLKYQTKAEQKKAAKSMIAACSAGAFRQAVSPGRTCGYRALKRGSKAGQGLAYARWGFPKGWPNVRFKNPGYSVAGLIVKTFKDDDGDWGYSVLTPTGDLLAVESGEPSEKVAAREGKSEALYQAEIMEVTARPNPRRGIKVRVEQDRMGDVTITPESAKVRKRLEKHLKQFGESGAEVFLQGWQGDQWLDENLTKAQQREVRQGWGLTMIMDPWEYGMLRGYDSSEVKMNPRPRKATKRKVVRKATKRRATDVRSLVAKALK